MTKTLPFEILEQIFSYVDQSCDLLQCLLTCQNWTRPALEKLYETVYLDNFRDTLADDLIQNMIYHPMEIAKSVQKIDLLDETKYYYEDDERFVKILNTMFNYCPNINSILSEFYEYEEPFWKSILEATTRKGKLLRNLQVIPSVHTTPELLEACYFPIVQQIKDRLKHIVISDKFMMAPSNLRDIPNTFCDLLSKTDFPKLESLGFEWKKSISLTNCELIINRCSNFTNFKTLSLGIKLDIDQEISYDDYCRLISTLPTTTGIKILHWRKEINNDIDMLYMMQKFTKLEKISLATTFSLSGTAWTFHSEQIISLFFEFVSQVPKLERSSVIFNKNNTANDYYRSLLVPLLKRDDVKELEVEYGVAASAQIDFRTIENQQRYGRGNDSKLNVKIQVDAGVDNAFVFLCLKEDGYRIKSLSLKSVKSLLPPAYRDQDGRPITPSVKSKEDDLYYLVNGFWFEHILKYCSTLKDLTIIGPDSNIKMHDNINDLEQNDSIERLTIHHFALSQSNSTVLSKLSKCLPALNYLTFVRGRVKRRRSRKKEEVDIVKIDLPYTSLQVFTWHDKANNRVSRDAYYSKISYHIGCYLKITLVENSQNFYYKLEGEKKSLLSEYNYYEAINKKKLDEEEILVIEISCIRISQFRLSLKNSDTTFDLNL